MNSNTISVILPVFNGENYIEDAIGSVLSQNYKKLEIIAVNDGSTDNSGKVLRNFGNQIIYIEQENGGPPHARNTALKHAKGEFITFIDQDDIWHQNKINTQLKLFKMYKNLDIVLGFSIKQQFDHTDTISSADIQEQKSFDLLLGSSLIRKAAFEKVGHFDSDLLSGDDTDWFLRVRELDLSIFVHRDLVFFHRLHEQNFTKKVSRAKYVLMLLKKVKDRKKTSGKQFAGALLKPEDMEEMIALWHTMN